MSRTDHLISLLPVVPVVLVVRQVRGRPLTRRTLVVPLAEVLTRSVVLALRGRAGWRSGSVVVGAPSLAGEVPR